MAPRTGSRHLLRARRARRAGRRFLSEREPYRFKEHTDTRVHVVAQGDSLEGLAGRYFAPLPAGLRLLVGPRRLPARPHRGPDARARAWAGALFVPSLRVLTDVILGEQRRRFDA
jgi:hypothetical protein